MLREPDKHFKLSPPSRPVICEWVVRAWDALSADMIESGFKRAKIIPSETEIDSELVLDLEKLHLVDTAVDSDDGVVSDDAREE